MEQAFLFPAGMTLAGDHLFAAVTINSEDKMTVTSFSNLAISEGIEAVWIGKKGSKSLTPALIQALRILCCNL